MPLKYTQDLNLQKYDVYHECDPYKPTFFDIQGVTGKTFGYGKHAFSIAVLDPDKNDSLYGFHIKDQSNLLFEIVDNDGETIHSGLTEIAHVNGSSYAYFLIEEDIKSTYYPIADGKAKLIIVGELAGPNLPKKWKNTYNIRTEIPFYIRKNQPNISPILFKSQPVSRVSMSAKWISNDTAATVPDHGWDPGLDYTNYHTHEFDNLSTYGGEVKYVDVYYALSSSHQHTDGFRHLDTQEITSSCELLTMFVSKSQGSSQLLTDNEIGTFNNSTKLNYWTKAETGTITTKVLANSLLLAGESNSVQKLIRYAVDDETFKIRLHYTGSGAFSILESRDSKSLSNPVNKSLLGDYRPDGVTTVFRREFDGGFNNQSIGPIVEGVVQPDSNASNVLGGIYEEKTFTVSSGSWFAVRLESDGSASFSRVSIKPSPQKGVNPSTFYYTTTVPQFTHGWDTIIYKYKFRNSNMDAAKQYDIFPVSEVETSTKELLYPPRVFSHRRNAHIAHRFRATSVNRNSAPPQTTVAIIGEAQGSGSSTITDQSWGSPANMTVGGVFRAIGTDSGSNPTIGTMGLYCQGFIPSGDEAASASVYSAVFTGTSPASPSTAGGGDVLIKQRLGIGDFDQSQQEHPDTTLHVKGDISSSGNLHIDGKLTAAEYHTYITSASIIHASGSTVFGNSSDDTHIFTGHITASGRISSSDLITGLNVKGVNSLQVGSGPISLVAQTGNTNNLTTLDTNGLYIQSHITASGHISSSGTGSFSHLIVDRAFGGADEEFFQIKKSGTTKFAVDEDGDIIKYGRIMGGDGNPNYFAGTIGGDGSYQTNFFYLNSTEPYLSDNGDKIMQWKNDEWIKLNQSRQNVDIWLNSSGDYYNLFSDGTNDKIGIGTNTPSKKLTVQGDISSSGGFFVSSSGNVMINSDLTGSMSTHLGSFSVNHGNATQLSGSLVDAGDGYGDIVKFGGTEGLTPGATVYLKSDGTWGVADATGGNAAAAMSSSLLGIAMGGNSDVDGVLLRGFVKHYSVHGGATTGQKVYVQSHSTGRVSTTVPSTSGNVVRVVGYCLSGEDNCIYFNPDNTWLEVS